MSNYTWGGLTKSLDDSETIEEAIIRLITAHNNDNESHLAEGQSLQSHRATEIIDHLAESIVEDKILNGELTLIKSSTIESQLNISYESLDGWVGSLTGISCSVSGLSIQTSSTINTVRKISIEPAGDPNALDWDKNLFFQTVNAFLSNTSQISYFGMGSLELDGTDNFFGFKVVDGTLYAIHIVGDGEDQVEYTTSISGITLTAFNSYRATFDPALGLFSFIVNGVLKCTQNSNIPTENMPVLFSFYLKNTSASNRVLYSKNLQLSKSL